MFVEDVRLESSMSAADLLRTMEKMGGFMGEHLGKAFNLLREIVINNSSLRLLSFTGNLVSTGLRGVFVEMLRRKWFDTVFTTCGAVDHDIARTRSRYMRGSFDADDYKLADQNIHRLGNVFIEQPSYGQVIEQEVNSLLPRLTKNEPVSVYELLWTVGENLGSESSMLYWCWKNKIPVFVPGIYDGAFGYQLWLQAKSKLRLDYMKDLDLLNELMWNNKTKTGLIIGGGISKHHLLWWAQFGDEGLDKAVYLSTADEYDGSLSGARPREAVSWHKISTKANHVFVKADATITLPLLVLGLIQEIG